MSATHAGKQSWGADSNELESPGQEFVETCGRIEHLRGAAEIEWALVGFPVVDWELACRELPILEVDPVALAGRDLSRQRSLDGVSRPTPCPKL